MFQTLWSFFVGVVFITQGIANAWPAFSRKTIPEVVGEVKWRNKVSLKQVFGVVSILIGVGVIYSNFSAFPKINVEEWTPSYTHLEAIRNQTFMNEDVLADGKSFSNCTFAGVTLVFKATHPFAISNSRIGTPLRLKIAQGPASMIADTMLEMVDQICATEKIEPCPSRQIIITRVPN